jgi:hypothetical protein
MVRPLTAGGVERKYDRDAYIEGVVGLAAG